MWVIMLLLSVNAAFADCNALAGYAPCDAYTGTDVCSVSGTTVSCDLQQADPSYTSETCFIAVSYIEFVRNVDHYPSGTDVPCSGVGTTFCAWGHYASGGFCCEFDDIVNNVDIEGTPYNDDVWLTSIDDSDWWLEAYSGLVGMSVTVDSGECDDRIFGSPDDGTSYWETFYGGEGDDYLAGDVDALISDGAETMYGEDGIDVLSGGHGSDTLDGGAGADQLYGGDGNDTIRGGAGSDSIHGENGADTINGHGGADWIDGGNGSDVLCGGGEADEIYGDYSVLWAPPGGSDILDGGSGLDTLRGGPSSDECSDYGVGGDIDLACESALVSAYTCP